MLIVCAVERWSGQYIENDSVLCVHHKCYTKLNESKHEWVGENKSIVISASSAM